MSHHPDGLLPPEGTNAPAPSRRDQPEVKTRNAVLAALKLPDASGLPSLDVLVTSVLGQRAQDRAFWLWHYFLAIYFLGHLLGAYFPCRYSMAIDTMKQLSKDLEQQEHPPTK